jgi:hypothetical protein
MMIVPVLPVLAQENENPVIPDETVIETIAKPAPVFYDPGDRKDPFFNYAPPKTAVRQVEDEEVPRGPQPDGIEGTFIFDAGVEGIIVVHNGNRRMVLIRGADARAYFLREGDRLYDGYLKTIDNDSVVFVRETLMRSGKTLTEEVTKRLREL